MKKKIIVIGGGAAGMLAALFAAREGASVRLLERNEKLGKKLYITGKGRCNLTNTAEGEAFMAAIQRNPRFLYAALSFFHNKDMMALMESLGVPLKVERGNRVFPVSDHAGDITAALRRELERLGVSIEYQCRVAHLILDEGVCCGVTLTDGAKLYADAVIVATGGMSYPSTGSEGDGYALAQEAGHGVTALRPSLVAVETRESWPGTLAGLTLKNVGLRAWKPGKKKPFYDDQGELLFTHRGISGPLTLRLSALLPDELEGVRIEIDMKPALDHETLDKRLLRDLKEFSRKQISAVMDGLEPHALGQQLLLLAGIPAQTPANAVTAAQRAKLLETLKGVKLTPKALGGFNEAVVTRGGVKVNEIDPSTLESKKSKQLYFAGEVMDIDAFTGGYNLQLAFSTGALAGASAAREEEL